MVTGLSPRFVAALARLSYTLRLTEKPRLRAGGNLHDGTCISGQYSKVSIILQITIARRLAQ
jgi:hypothetical protein